ncbi:helix-turn-helix domain-containing protein [Priestia flexa]|uniref:helix-turn-helix domain-containing protein n=1 Tax=Priestia flexa TaxID=86664 RepID=UPI00240D4DDA|nr:helix-turn-helix transcriptional regulator [Priestia flexa]WEZ09556.1 helix-turn-helix transcriptional regulator [Priestia flexa]
MIVSNLRTLLDEAGMSLNQFAKLADLNYDQAWNLANMDKLAEQGKPVKMISVKVLNNACKTLDCELHDLIKYVKDK